MTAKNNLNPTYVIRGTQQKNIVLKLRDHVLLIGETEKKVAKAKEAPHVASGPPTSRANLSICHCRILRNSAFAKCDLS